MKPVGNVSVRRRAAVGLEVEGRAGMMQSSIIWRPAALVASSYRPAVLTAGIPELYSAARVGRVSVKLT